MISTEIAEALGSALALGLPAFPCRADKAPTCPQGFRAGVSDPAALRDLWHRHPGLLVGVPTGALSGVDALDIDAPRHTEAAVWWEQVRGRVPPTRIHATRSAGLHVLFQHRSGMRSWVGRPLIGVDGRGDGGYIIWWPAAGLSLISDAPLAPWPEWLIAELKPQDVAGPGTVSKSLAELLVHRTGSRYADAALTNAALRVARSSPGSRNNALNGEAYGLGRLIAAGLLDGQTVADSLAAAAMAAGLVPREIEATLRSAFGARGLL
jgi:hypothetical protein